jgi:hypothetical protein
MIYKTTNNRVLLISDRDSVTNIIGSKRVPYIVLIAVWSLKQVSDIAASNVISFLLQEGTTNFVCFGGFSEQLHDEIDELIYQYSDKNSLFDGAQVITTYHDDEELDEVINYFVHGTEINDNNKNCQLILIDGFMDKQDELRDLLAKI